MIELSQAFQVAAITAVVHMTLYYFYSLYKKDTSVVDIGWGLGFVLIVWVLSGLIDDPSSTFLLLTLMVSAWGLRLGSHIMIRKGDKGEDWRYQNMREKDPENWWWLSYFKVFLLQAFLTLIIASPLVFAAANTDKFEADPIIILGVALWSIGFYFEVVGDYQLSRFLKKKQARKNPKRGKQFMTEGLWAYTRHPNYFGEVTLWWGIYLVVLSIGGSWWTIISPLTITYLLLKVSGITMLEAKYEGNKEFQKYKKKTSAFFPKTARKGTSKKKPSNKK